MPLQSNNDQNVGIWFPLKMVLLPGFPSPTPQVAHLSQSQLPGSLSPVKQTDDAIREAKGSEGAGRPAHSFPLTWARPLWSRHPKTAASAEGS